MREFKGTKGEWRVAPVTTNDTDGFEIHWSDIGECVTDHVYTIEDAKLIAAAPELLKQLIACEKALRIEGYGELARSEINNAINKAL